MNNLNAPITYRELHEYAAGMPLCDEFFKVSHIDPDASVKCNCKFDCGHEPTCDIVAAHELLAKRQNKTNAAVPFETLMRQYEGFSID